MTKVNLKRAKKWVIMNKSVALILTFMNILSIRNYI